jgi:hypothetical protein
MKFAADHPYADREKAARKPVEIGLRTKAK